MQTHKGTATRHSRGRAALALSIAAPGVLLASPHPPQPTIEEVTVYGRAQQQLGTASSASEGLVAYADLRLPPLLRVGELAEAVPGMVATQHSGTGKANQYFLRGFNLDHGTDFAAHVDGVPINMRSHGHGQGYLDLNFLIPELIESTRYRKGPYSAAVGDFSAAGSVEFSHYAQLPETILQITAGEYGYQRGLAAGTVGALAVASRAPWTSRVTRAPGTSMKISTSARAISPGSATSVPCACASPGRATTASGSPRTRSRGAPWPAAP
jgi:outer membrane cobalamin receptor